MPGLLWFSMGPVELALLLWAMARTPFGLMQQCQPVHSVPVVGHRVNSLRQRTLDRHLPVMVAHVFSHTNSNSAGFGDVGTRCR